MRSEGSLARKRERDKLYRRRIRGVQLLDGVDPFWRGRVDPDELDLSLESSCVLGQVFGGVSRGVLKLTGGNLGRRWDLNTFDWCVSHGFDARIDESYDLLTELWRLEVTRG